MFFFVSKGYLLFFLLWRFKYQGFTKICKCIEILFFVFVDILHQVISPLVMSYTCNITLGMLRSLGVMISTSLHKKLRLIYNKKSSYYSYNCLIPNKSSGDPLGARTQDPNIKSVVLYLLSQRIRPFCLSFELRVQKYGFYFYCASPSTLFLK